MGFEIYENTFGSSSHLPQNGFKPVLETVPYPFNTSAKYKVITWGHEVQNNSLGFREREFARGQSSDSYRIMVLGDSLTWGAGLSPSERYTNLLERSLSAATSRSVEVLNFGIEGGPTTVEADIFEFYHEMVQPDLVVLGFCLNDPQPKGQDYSRERDILLKNFSVIVNFIDGLAKIGLSNTASRSRKAFFRLAELFGTVPTWFVALDRVYEKSSSEWINFQAALRRIKTLSDQLGLPAPIFAILNQGESTISASTYGNPSPTLSIFLRWYHQAEEAARELGYTTVNFEDLLSSKLRNEILAINEVDGHPSAAVNKIYAERLHEIILPIIKSNKGGRES